MVKTSIQWLDNCGEIDSVVYKEKQKKLENFMRPILMSIYENQ